MIYKVFLIIHVFFSWCYEFLRSHIRTIQSVLNSWCPPAKAFLGSPGLLDRQRAERRQVAWAPLGLIFSDLRNLKIHDFIFSPYQTLKTFFLKTGAEWYIIIYSIYIYICVTLQHNGTLVPWWEPAAADLDLFSLPMKEVSQWHSGCHSSWIVKKTCWWGWNGKGHWTVRFLFVAGQQFSPKVNHLEWPTRDPRFAVMQLLDTAELPGTAWFAWPIWGNWETPQMRQWTWARVLMTAEPCWSLFLQDTYCIGWCNIFFARMLGDV